MKFWQIFLFVHMALVTRDEAKKVNEHYTNASSRRQGVNSMMGSEPNRISQLVIVIPMWTTWGRRRGLQVM